MEVSNRTNKAVVGHRRRAVGAEKHEGAGVRGATNIRMHRTCQQQRHRCGCPKQARYVLLQVRSAIQWCLRRLGFVPCGHRAAHDTVGR